MKGFNQFIRINLVLALLIILLVPSAGAVEVADKNNSRTDTNYPEAVTVLEETGILMDNFVADQPLTRAKAAQVVSRMILGPTTANKLEVTTALFSDVPADNPYAGYIAYCVKEGLISGYTDGTFKTNSGLTGYAFFKLLLGTLGYDAEAEGYVGENWSINVAKRVSELGLTSGLKGVFDGYAVPTQEEACLYVLNTLKADMKDYEDPEDTEDITEQPLTRGSAAQLLVDAFDLEYDSEMTIPFTDVPKTSPYYEAVCICYHRGILNGYTDGIFRPNDSVTRGTLAFLLYKCGLPSGYPDTIPSDVSSTS